MITLLLERLNLSTTGAARLLGVSPSTVRGWGAGSRNGVPAEPPEYALRLLELAADVPMARKWLENRAYHADRP